jgi:hypothetical protein
VVIAYLDFGRDVCIGGEFGRDRRRREFFELAHFLEELKGARGFCFVDFAEGEADVDEDIVTGDSIRRVLEADFLDDAAEVSFAHEDAMGIGSDGKEFTGNGEAHDGGGNKESNERTVTGRR